MGERMGVCNKYIFAVVAVMFIYNTVIRNHSFHSATKLN